MHDPIANLCAFLMLHQIVNASENASFYPSNLAHCCQLSFILHEVDRNLLLFKSQLIKAEHHFWQFLMHWVSSFKVVIQRKHLFPYLKGKQHYRISCNQARLHDFLSDQTEKPAVDPHRQLVIFSISSATCHCWPSLSVGFDTAD